MLLASRLRLRLRLSLSMAESCSGSSTLHSEWALTEWYLLLEWYLAIQVGFTPKFKIFWIYLRVALAILRYINGSDKHRLNGVLLERNLPMAVVFLALTQSCTCGFLSFLNVWGKFLEVYFFSETCAQNWAWKRWQKP